MTEFEFVKLNFDNTDLTEEERILQNKRMSRMMKKARENAKLDKCYYCGAKNPQYCNSHSIPQFTLRNIAQNGMLLYTNKLVKVPCEKEEKGINESGTFKMICRECDSKIFVNYENPDNYLGEITPKMLAETSLKNYLKSISKRLIEIELYKQVYSLTDNPFIIEQLDQKQLINHADLGEYQRNYEKAKRIAKKDWKNEYYMIYKKKLDYVIPVAFQSNLALVCDLENNIINDIYNEDAKYRQQDIQLSVFPLKDCSIVLLFIDSNSKRYRPFYKQFERLSEDEKLEVLNYIMFLYSEDIFFSPTVEEAMIESKELAELTKTTTDLVATKSNPFEEDDDYTEAVKKQFGLKDRVDIPNFLSEEYKVN